MQISDGMLLDMNDPPPLGFRGQLPPHHPQDQTGEYWNKMQMKHLESKDQHVLRQPPTSSSISTMPLTSGGGDLEPDDNLFLPRSNADEEQLTASLTQMDYNEFGIIVLKIFLWFSRFFSSDMDDEGLINIQHLNSVYRPGDGITGGQPSSFTTPIHHSQGNMPQSVSAVSSCLSKSIINNNSTKDESLIMNTYSTPFTSNMTPPLSNMFQKTNTLQSSSSNSSTTQVEDYGRRILQERSGNVTGSCRKAPEIAGSGSSIPTRNLLDFFRWIPVNFLCFLAGTGGKSSEKI